MTGERKNSSTSGTFTIINRLGMHARAAAQFVQLANGFKSEIYVARDGQEINGKSIMGILMLAAAQGSEITVRAEGEDAERVLEVLGELINNRFGEEE